MRTSTLLVCVAAAAGFCAAACDREEARPIHTHNDHVRAILEADREGSVSIPAPPMMPWPDAGQNPNPNPNPNPMPGPDGGPNPNPMPPIPIPPVQTGTAPEWKDTIDGGDDPFTAGCHLGYTAPNCGNRIRNAIYGDVCHQNGLDLTEWTDQMCHPSMPLDSKIYYCDAECRRRNMDGCCETVALMCDGMNIRSARCKCVPNGARCP